jgi:UDP-N-acetyl-D-mannosaminuronic acid dehydrogenase
MGSAEAAELTKLAETTYRDVNIALANELARFADRQGIDIEKVIAAANSQPFSHIHHPGIAVGGHCIPVYPRFFLSGDPDARLPAAAREVNESMPAYAVGRLSSALDGGLGGKRVLILGVTYRGDVKETAFSGAFGAKRELERLGAVALAADPLFSAAELGQLGFDAWDGNPVDAAVIQADHTRYRDLGPDDLPGVGAILDGRGVLDAPAWLAAGVKVVRLGAP